MRHLTLDKKGTYSKMYELKFQKNTVSSSGQINILFIETV